ncbi:phosphatidate cytidylyltransferase [Botryobacter ruber]|uniref:phosphatidate cytidylyltransferase n=1 Tax=Botryobacter ruber TaxID=2171629 RepID=UPI000E0C8F2B|nr:phosphatidate cytidylyltransferase [Botryobacter ruber]
MREDILNTFILAGLFLALFGVAELLHHGFNIKADHTRKIVHACTGMLTLLFPVMLGNHWLVLLLCSAFALILIASMRYNLLKSINAIDRPSVGSIAYPVAVYGCYLAFEHFEQQYLYFYLPVLTLAICDPIAASTGKKWAVGRYKVGRSSKTMMGSGMFFLSAFVLVSFLSIVLTEGAATNEVLLRAGIIAFIAAVSEGFSRNGYDNLTIPASVLLCMMFFV